MMSVMKGQKGVEQSYEVTAIHNEMRSLLGDSKACLNSLGDFIPGTDDSPTVDGASVTQLERKDETPVYSVGGLYARRTIKISEMKVGTYVANDAAANPYEGTAKLRIVFERQGPATGPKTLVRDIDLWVELKNASETEENQIKACRALVSTETGEVANILLQLKAFSIPGSSVFRSSVGYSSVGTFDYVAKGTRLETLTTSDIAVSGQDNYGYVLLTITDTTTAIIVVSDWAVARVGGNNNSQAVTVNATNVLVVDVSPGNTYKFSYRIQQYAGGQIQLNNLNGMRVHGVIRDYGIR